METANMTHWSVQRALPYILLCAAAVGLTASLALTYDKLQLLHDPAYHPNCNLSPVLSCQSVMDKPQASTFGLPNSVFGLVAYSGLGMFSLALLAGAQLRRWFWIAAQIGITAGMISVLYLIYESAFRLHTICPWCFCVWMVTIPAFWAMTVRNLREGVFGRLHKHFGVSFERCVEQCPGDLLGLGYVCVLGLLLIKFWYYWRTLL